MIDQEYARLVRAVGRVIVRHDATTPLETMAAVAGRTQWLRRICVSRLDREIGVTFPLIVVRPVCWVAHTGDGEEGIVTARVAPVALRSKYVWGVELSAVVLLEYSNDMVEGVLAHEFLHYVWHTAQTVAKIAANPDGTIDLSRKRWHDHDAYVTGDHARRARPAEWLSERLQRLLAAVEDGHSPSLMAAHQRIADEWLRPRRLPVERIALDSRFQFEGTMALDAEVVRRQWQLEASLL